MIGIELDHEGMDYVPMAMERGFLINCTMGNVLRFLPPLTITQSDIDRLLNALEELLSASKASS